MSARLPTQLTTTTGAPLPLPAMPQDRLLTVNIEQIPLFKDILGVPGIHIKPLRLDLEAGGRVVLATFSPGAKIPLHYHTGVAEVYTMSGRWYYLEYPDQPQTAGSYMYEPAGSVHTFVCPESNTEDTVLFIRVEGANINFTEEGQFHSLTDAVLVQHLTETAAAARGIGPVGYIRGNGADVIGS